jgi:DNA-directed RNA polymerase specialized sigma24 family protein
VRDDALQEAFTTSLDGYRRDFEPDPASLEKYEIVQKCLARLPEDLKEVLNLRLIEELSIAETAERLQVAPGTVGSREHRARHQLSELLNACGFGGSLHVRQYLRACDRVSHGSRHKLESDNA